MAQVENCCCCFSVRTGTLILGWATAIGAALEFASLMAGGKDIPLGAKLAPLLGLAAATLLVLGTYQKRPAYFMPYMILNVLALIGMFITMFVLVIIGIVLLIMGTDYFAKSPIHEVAKLGALVEFIFAAIFGLFTWLHYHFFKVVRTHYTQVKHETEPYNVSGMGV